MHVLACKSHPPRHPQLPFIGVPKAVCIGMLWDRQLKDEMNCCVW